MTFRAVTPKHPTSANPTRQPRPWVLVGLGLTLVVGGALALSAAATQTSGFGVVPKGAVEAKQELDKVKKERRVEHKGRRLLDELLPTDEVLEVIDWQPSGTPALPPEGRSAIEMLTIDRPLVATVKVRSLTGAFSPDGKWVETIVTADVERVEKNATTLLNLEGGQLVFATPYGELTIGKQKIRSVRADIAKYEIGRSYLVFLMQRGSEWFVSPTNSALVDGAALVPLSPAGSIFSSDKHAVLNEIAAYSLVRK